MWVITKLDERVNSNENATEGAEIGAVPSKEKGVFHLC
jgi:hypothetical protein